MLATAIRKQTQKLQNTKSNRLKQNKKHFKLTYYCKRKKNVHFEHVLHQVNRCIYLRCK